MAMMPERSNPLHNFNLPTRLRWGIQRHLRCKKPDEETDNGSDGIEAIGEKLMNDFKLKIDKISNGKASPATVVGVFNGDECSFPMKQWNLRVRRSVLAAEGDGVMAVDRSRKVGIRERCFRVCDDEKVVKRLRVRLEREEIEKDFAAMGGIKLPRRPKKRPRAIQKKLDALFPGLRLNEVNLEMYAVREAPGS